MSGGPEPTRFRAFAYDRVSPGSGRRDSLAVAPVVAHGGEDGEGDGGDRPEDPGDVPGVEDEAPQQVDDHCGRPVDAGYEGGEGVVVLIAAPGGLLADGCGAGRMAGLGGHRAPAGAVCWAPPGWMS